eukprot:g17632.t1
MQAATCIFTGLFSPSSSSSSSSSLLLYAILIIDSATRRRVEAKVFHADLEKIQIPTEYEKIQIPTEYVQCLIKAYVQSRELLISSAQEQRTQLPSLEKLSWRCDVCISTSQLSRVFTPSLILQLTCSDGKIHTFECSRDMFHLLRFNVAKILKNMQDLNSHPTLMQDI